MMNNTEILKTGKALSTAVNSLVENCGDFLRYEIRETTFQFMKSSERVLRQHDIDSHLLFNKYGIHIHTDDLHTQCNAPAGVKKILPELIHNFGYDLVNREIAIQLKHKYPGDLCIVMVSEV